MVNSVRNIIIGIDGGCFEHIEPLLKRNLLPNFKKLIDNGFSSKLLVTLPPSTIPSWPCLFSGLTPEQLGFPWFIVPEKGIFNSNFWRSESLFSINDLKSFILNVPGTYPAWIINGEMITGMLSPSISCYPKELEYILKKNWIIEGKSILEIFQAFEIKSRLFLKKLKEDFNLMVYVIKIPDSISHRAHTDYKRLLKILTIAYKKIDNFLRKILKDNSFDNIIILSDHGLKYFKKEFNLSRWLEKRGLILINISGKTKYKSILLKFYDIIRIFINPIYFKKVYELNLEILNLIFRKNNNKNRESTKIIKKKTRIDYDFSNVGALFLEGKDKLKKQIIKVKLKQDKHVKAVISCNLKNFPDLYIILKDKYLIGKDPSFFIKRRRNTVNHSQYGIFIAYGNNIKKGRENVVDYKDIAPTILKLFNIKKREFMTGKPLNIFIEK